jgi:hypothetical protein
MANRLCPVCGEEFVEWATTCSDCGVALVDPAVIDDMRHLPDEQRVVYELETWSLDQRTEVAEAMAESGYPHTWDGEDLIVHVDHEAAVDRLLDPIERRGPSEVVEPGTQTEYDMAEWPADERAMVVERLTEAGVPHAWEGDLLLVPVEDESVVDDILDDIEEGGDAAALTDDGEETPFEVLESLFLAAQRLRHDVMDADGLQRLVDSMEDADPDRPPFGMDISVWRRAMTAADSLAEAIGGEDGLQHAEAERSAEQLHDLLRPFV